MEPETVGAALTAGVAAFLVVGVAVTELLASTIEFSLLVGIPAGVAAGIAATGVVALYYEDERWGRRRYARALAGFGVVFCALLVVGVAARLRPTVALLVAVAVGAVVGGVGLLWRR